MKKIFNIWVYRKEAKSPTGPWEFGFVVVAINEIEALEIAKSRFGLNRQYQIHEGL